MECSFRDLGHSLNGGYAEKLRFYGINLAMGADCTDRRITNRRGDDRSAGRRLPMRLRRVSRAARVRIRELQRALEVVDQP
jgi:hypothetical protein